VTGRIVDAKAEADGDIHLALQDATGDAVGTISAEIPVGLKWREIRQIVFGWTVTEVSVQRQNRPHAQNSRAKRHHGDRQSVLRSFTRACGSLKPTSKT